MKDYNPNISDQEIQYLLKCRLIEQVADDSFTQKQLDMETELILNDELLILPSIEKEKAFIKKLSKARARFGYWKWFFSLLIVGIIGFYFSYSKKNNNDKNPQILSVPVVEIIKTKKETIESNGTVETKQINKISTQTNQPILLINTKDSLSMPKKPKWVLGDAGVRGTYQMGELPPVEPLENFSNREIPVLSKEQIKENEKLKEKMIKQLIKKDKSAWAYIPMSTDVFKGDTISLNAFYMATAEVTNKQYGVFLNDLLIQGKVDDYIKAFPDTSKIQSMWRLTLPDYPIVNISREGAQMYCNWLTNATNNMIVEMYKNTSNSYGQNIPNSIYMNDLRLPQDVEWVIAARGGLGDVKYPWNTPGRAIGLQNERGCYLCNFSITNYTDTFKYAKGSYSCKKNPNATTSGACSLGEGYFTVNTFSYNPNEYGLFSLCGNAAEMVWDYKTKKPGTKGGSWNSDADHVKINAEDEYSGITKASPFIGFRPVFTTQPKKKK